MQTLFHYAQQWKARQGCKRVLAMLQRQDMPSWVLSSTLTSPSLRAMGAYIKVHTDKKPIYLQVSPNYKWSSISKHHTSIPLAIIVCDDTTSDSHLRMRLLEGLEYGYNRT